MSIEQDNKWLLLEDVTPRDGLPVLCVKMGKHPHIKVPRVAFYNENADLWFDMSLCERGIPTHWMFLPSLPAAKDNL